MRMHLSFRNRIVLALAAFSAIGLSILPADLDAMQSAKVVSPAKPAPTFNAPPIPQEALNRAPVVAPPEVSRPTEASLVPWRPTRATQPAQPAVQQAALEAPVGEPPADLRPEMVSSAVNVRSAGQKGSPVLFVLPRGAEIRVAETNGGWVHVYSDRGEGWVYSTFIGKPAPTPSRTSEPDVSGRTMRLASAVVVRDEPDGYGIYELDAGERVRIVEVEGKWVRIVTSSGEGGWVRLR